MGTIRFAVTKPIDSSADSTPGPDRFAQLERRVRLLELMTTGDGFVSFQDLRSREGTPLADPNPNFNGIPIPRGAGWFVALFDHDDKFQTNPLGGKFFYNAIEKDRFTVGFNVFVKEL